MMKDEQPREAPPVLNTAPAVNSPLTKQSSKKSVGVVKKPVPAPAVATDLSNSALVSRYGSPWQANFHVASTAVALF